MTITSDGLYLDALTTSGNIEVFHIDAATGGLTQVQVVTGIARWEQWLGQLLKCLTHPPRFGFHLESNSARGDKPHAERIVVERSPLESLQLRSQITEGVFKSYAKLKPLNCSEISLNWCFFGNDE